MATMYDVFISHSSKDRDEVSNLCSILEREFSVWVSFEDIEGSDEWLGKIIEGLTNSAVFLAFWTKNAGESTWVQKEILEALEQRKPIIPMVFDDTPLSISLKDRQFIDFHSSPTEAIGSVGRKIKEYRGKLPTQVSKEVSWKYESTPSPWNNFFEQNNYLHSRKSDFANNINTSNLYDHNAAESPLEHFVTFVAAPVPNPLEPIDLPETFKCPDVVFPVQSGINSIGKVDHERPWRWFNLMGLTEKSAYQEFFYFESARHKMKRDTFATLRFLRFTEDGAIEYAPRHLALTINNDVGTAMFMFITLLGEMSKFLGLINVLYPYWDYRGNFQVLINLKNTYNAILGEFAPGWSDDYYTNQHVMPSYSTALNMQFVYTLNAGIFITNPDMSMELMDDLSRRIQSSFGLSANKRHLDTATNQFPWIRYYQRRFS